MYPVLTHNCRIELTDDEQTEITFGSYKGSIERGVITISKKEKEKVLTTSAVRFLFLKDAMRIGSEVTGWENWAKEATAVDGQGWAFSYQFQNHLIETLRLTTAIGIHPLLASPHFLDSWASWNGKDGWSAERTDGRRYLLVLPRTPKKGHLELLDRLGRTREGSFWAVLAPQQQGVPEIRKWLRTRGRLIGQFPKGSIILHQRGAWKKASTKTRPADHAWELYAPAEELEDTRRSMQLAVESFKGTALGTSRLLHIPREERLWGQKRQWLNKSFAGGPATTIAASDGSLKKDGGMAAAAVLLGQSPKEWSSALVGDPEIVRAELGGIT
jgi:hypothetical protein